MYYSGTFKRYNNENLVCKWPPKVVDDTYQWDSGFDISICVRPDVNASNNSANIRYPLKTLFQGAQSEEVVSFEEIAELPRGMWETVKYPEVYQTYPQDVPLKQLVNDIKAGSPVAYVS
ncbi:unnamed protein product [Taenia asiatica]|uniref:Diphosphate--fructose-6-phosphate 1-phosphotransferase n=1 Tax=Taenia asiatica TaxID=60517 RepID=A0A0R3WGZ7_TAEAS|nr:unnamed protein product [Taenia asiatica]